MKHQIGLTIGNNTLTNYTEIKKGRRAYIFTCTCGKIIHATNLSISRMLNTYETTGCSGCMNCIRKCKSINNYNDVTKYGDIHNRYKKGAKRRNIEFHLTPEESAKLFAGNCNYCGDAPTGTYSRSKYYTTPYNGIDRVNTKKHYTIDNCVSCCRACNVAKHEMSVSEFLNQVEKIYLFNSQRLSRKGVDPSGSKQKAV